MRSFYSNLLSGESFEPSPDLPWLQTLLPPTAHANVSVQVGAGMHGLSALRVQYLSGTGLAGRANRGFRNEGLYLEGGRTYEGYLFVKSEAAATVEVSLRAYTVPNSTSAHVLARSVFWSWNCARYSSSTHCGSGSPSESKL